MTRISDMTPLPTLPASGGRIPLVKDGDGANYLYDLAADQAARPTSAALAASTGYQLVGGVVRTVTPQQFQVSSGLPLPLGGGIQDDSAAFVAAIAYLKSIAVNPDTYYKGSPRLFVPAGTYNMGTTTLDITHTLIIDGESSINGYGTRLSWSGDATGIRIQAYNTSGASSTVTPGFNGGNYTIIRSLGLAGPYYNSSNFTGKTEGEYHGIHARSNYIIEDCDIDGFAGDGVYVETSSGGGGALEGNSNCSFINRLKVTNVRNGLYVDGADANAGTFIGIVGTYCRRWTIWDSSFLGNTHIGHHSANAGLVRGVAPCISVQGGNRYAVIAGQEVGASTNAPSGTTADNTWWLYIGAGAVDATLNIAAWTNGTTYRAGGSYHTDSLNGYNTLLGLYEEGGQACSQITQPTCIVGGLWGTRNPVTTGNWFAGHRCDLWNFKLIPQNDPGALENGMMWASSAGDKIRARLSGATVNIMADGAAVAPASVAATGAITSSGAGIGYVTGAGGAVTQLTSKSTAPPAINKLCGQITMNNAALAAGAKVSFTVSNSQVAATDLIIANVVSGGTANAYRAEVTAVASSSFTVTVENITAGSLSEAPVIGFAIIRGAAS